MQITAGSKLPVHLSDMSQNGRRVLQQSISLEEPNPYRHLSLVVYGRDVGMMSVILQQQVHGLYTGRIAHRS